MECTYCDITKEVNFVILVSIIIIVIVVCTSICVFVRMIFIFHMINDNQSNPLLCSTIVLSLSVTEMKLLLTKGGMLIKGI